MGLQVPHFPFPTPPEAGALIAAQICLVALSALQPPSHSTTPLGLTSLGRAMSCYPITPRHARMLLQASHVFLFAGMERECCHACWAPKCSHCCCKYGCCPQQQQSLSTDAQPGQSVTKCYSSMLHKTALCAISTALCAALCAEAFSCMVLCPGYCSIELPPASSWGICMATVGCDAPQAALHGKGPKKGKPVVAYAVALAAALSIESPFMHVDNLMVCLLLSLVWFRTLPTCSNASCCFCLVECMC